MTLKCMEYDSFVTGEIFVSEHERKAPRTGLVEWLLYGHRLRQISRLIDVSPFN